MAFTSCIGRSLAACTIISRNYLSHARVLAQSFLEHEPGGRFYLLVIDPVPEGLDLDGRIRLIRPEDLALPYYADMTFRYGVTELSTAVKPTFLRLLLKRHGEDPVVYFDPDILVTAPLDALRESLGAAGIVLTPHLLAPIPQDGREPTESSILIAGAYNLGFVALRAATETEAFLLWWEDRLRDACVVDLPRGLMVDQKWVDLVPGIFPSTGILRDLTYNVAYWNIHARPLEERGGRFLVHGRPLTFFHFSGFNPAKPQVFSKHQNRTAVVPGTPLAKLVDRYVQLHLENGFDRYSRLSYGYGRFDNGAAIIEPIRRVYRELDETSRARFGNPFKAAEPGTFFDWGIRPRPDEGRFSPFLESVYRSRPDLMEEWPDVHGRHREAFLTWALEHGPKELGYDAEVMRIRDHFPTPAVARRGYPDADPEHALAVAIGEWPGNDGHLAGTRAFSSRPRALGPLASSVAPALGEFEGKEQERQAYRLLAARSQQLYQLLQLASRPHLRLHPAKTSLASPHLPEGGAPSGEPSTPPTEHQLLFRGEVRWLSRECTNRLVSVLLPVKNGAAKLRELLPRILSQRSRHPVEIVAVDSGSADETVAVLRQFRATAIGIDPGAFNHGLTRNLAAQYARGEVFVFLNQSTLPADEQWLANLVAPLEADPDVAGVCGRVLPRPEADPLTAKDIGQNINASTRRYARGITDWEAYCKLEPHERRLFLNFHTLSAALRASVFRRIPFREANFAEDLIWGKDALEAGFKIQYEPSAVVYHSHNYGLLELFRRLFDDGLACRAIVGKQLRECDILPKIVQEFRDDWRYLEQECHLDARELEEWRLIAVLRRTAQVLGLWIGMDWERDRHDLFAHLSLTERIKAGIPTEADGGWRL